MLFHWRKSEPGENQTADEGNKKIKGKKQGLRAPHSQKARGEAPKPWSQGQLDGVYWGYTVKPLIRGSHFAITKSEALGDRTQKCAFFKSSPNIYAY